MAEFVARECIATKRDGVELEPYMILVTVIDTSEPLRHAWCDFVRAAFPEAPAGFRTLGRPTNAPKRKPSNEPSPKIGPFPAPPGFVPGPETF